MREIKFRVYDKIKQKMFTGGSCMDVSQTQGVDRWVFGIDLFNHPDDVEIMQYTGLKDKNGKEIYEGDIVRMPADLWIGSESVGVAKGTFRDDAFIEFVDGSFRLNKLGDESKNYYGIVNYSTNNQSDKLEVIGNIYENKELLNDK